MAEKTLNYSNYLHLSELLECQKLVSLEHNKKAHDEMLFIVIHQVYELWFKQIIHELDSVIEMFNKNAVDEKSIGIAVSRLHRITEIQKLLIDQLRVLETMTPLDFLDFRDLLIPASGFQSFQFRMIENKLGLKSEARVMYNNNEYFHVLTPEQQKLLTKTAEMPTLRELIEKWLERTPFMKFNGFDFWNLYKSAVDKMLQKEEDIIKNNPTFSDERRTAQLKDFGKTRESFQSIFDENIHNNLREQGLRKLSHKAFLAALFINLYRDEPILNLPFRFLNVLADIDELFTMWRYRHALMVHRMIGSKIGTGGSSGHQYLMSTLDKHRIFTDLFNISTYLIPRSELPVLPSEMQKHLGFYYTYIDSK